uniref:AAA_13 domain-containing protein n=1 Tax=Strongyloides papillosus TaxID=174720 RepID=A0A0N5BM24_STREA
MNRFAKEIYIGSHNLRFDDFIKGFKEGNYNSESKAINNTYKLKRQCYQLPKADVRNCKSEILDFGTYALSSSFLKNSKIKNEDNIDENVIEDMISGIKEELRILIDRKTDIFDIETIRNFFHELTTMKIEKSLILMICLI